MDTQNIQVYQPENKFAPIIEATLNGVGAGSRPVYQQAIQAYLDWAQLNVNTDAYSSLMAYRRHLEGRELSIGTINRHLSALRNFFRTARNMGAIPEEVFRHIAEVKNIPSQGQKRGNWLSLEEAQVLLASPDGSTLKGLRDKLILGFMLGCGLRRSEVAKLQWDHIAVRDGIHVIENLLGKHNRTRSIPMQAWLVKLYDLYRVVVKEETEDSGLHTKRLFWSINRHGSWGESITSQAVWNIVAEYTEKCGFEHIAPHDLRRTYAELMRRNGAELEEIQALLGHSSLTTTQHYLAREVDPERVSQIIPLEI